MDSTEMESETGAAGYSGEGPMSTVVAVELADALDESPTESPPLADAVDTDALDRLFRNSDADIELTFSHADRRIFLSDAGVTIRLER